MADCITKIERNGAYYKVDTEDGLVFRVPSPMMQLFPLRIGIPFDFDAYMSAHVKEAFRFACERAVFFLDKKDYPSEILKEKLTECGYTDETGNAVISLLQERGYVDDRRYAKNLTERRSKKIGPYRIRQELMMKKIDRETIDAVMDEGLSDRDGQLALAKQYVEKYARTRKGQDKRKLRANAASMLVRKGFSFDTAREACQAFFDEE